MPLRARASSSIRGRLPLKPDNFVIHRRRRRPSDQQLLAAGLQPRVIGREIRVPESFEQLLAEADRDLGCGSDACMI